MSWYLVWFCESLWYLLNRTMFLILDVLVSTIQCVEMMESHTPMSACYTGRTSTWAERLCKVNTTFWESWGNRCEKSQAKLRCQLWINYLQTSQGLVNSHVFIMRTKYLLQKSTNIFDSNSNSICASSNLSSLFRQRDKNVNLKHAGVCETSWTHCCYIYGIQNCFPFRYYSNYQNDFLSYINQYHMTYAIGSLSDIALSTCNLMQ